MKQHIFLPLYCNKRKKSTEEKTTLLTQGTVKLHFKRQREFENKRKIHQNCRYIHQINIQVTIKPSHEERDRKRRVILRHS